MNLEEVLLDEGFQDGIWFEFGEGFEMKIRHAGSIVAKEANKEIMASIAARQQRKLNIPDEVYTKALAAYAAKGLIVDWKGLDKEGKEFPFSEEAAFEILSNPKYKMIFDFVFDIASKNDFFITSK